MPPPNNKEKIMVKDSDSIIVQGVKHYVQRYKFKFKGDYKQADENAISTYAWRLPEGKTKDNLQVGDEICIKSECFNFIGYDGNNIKMLSKWNLKVGNIYEYDSGYTPERLKFIHKYLFEDLYEWAGYL